MRCFLVAVLVLLATSAARAAPALVPQPAMMTPLGCSAPMVLDRALRFPATIDAGGFELLRERWIGLGIPAPVLVRERADVHVQVHSRLYSRLRSAISSRAAGGGRAEFPGEYDLTVDGSIAIAADGRVPGGESEFDALATLAQLPERSAGRWVLPCVHVTDWPQMHWRIISDDVSRGPFPTMTYAKQRIRALASLKVNGWAPYMEQVFVDPRMPFVAWPSGWNAQQLRELATYARRYHVALIPQQQTFAHMHESLKWEQLAPLAELPHGYLVAQSDARTYAYLEPLVKSVADAAKPAPFVHLGADEPLDLGRGRTPRTAQAFAGHVTRVASFLAGTGARPMIWDDAIQQDASILGLIPKDTVIVTFHYGVEKTYKPYIERVSSAGFDQMISPGAANWNEIYPDLTTSYANVARFTNDAKSVPGMLGMFMTVWHDDGESLFEATWPALGYAAASAWQRVPVEDASWHRTFARAFFGSDDPRYAAALDALQAIRPMLRTDPSDPPDYLFWRNPFDPALQQRARTMDLAGVRTRAETVMTDLWAARPPLHAQAAGVMRLGALRYDQLARRLQIGKEARDDYDDARAHATKPEVSQVYRSLNVAKYLCWELRNGLTDVEPLYAAAWRAESTEPGLDRILVRYHTAQSDAQRCADRIDAVTREDYLRRATVPPWDEVMSSAR